MKLASHPVLVLATLAVILHALILLAVHRYTGAVDFFAFASLDSGEYYDIARNIAHDRVFSQSEHAPFVPDTWRTPGYPAFLAVLMLILGESAVRLVLAQQVLAVANVLLVFLVAHRHMSDRRALIAALIVLFEPFHLYYSLWLLATTLFVTVLLLTWYLYEVATRSSGYWRFAVLGVLCGVLVLVRPVGVLVPLVVLAGLLFRRAPGSAPREFQSLRCGRAGAFALCAGVLIASWMARNQKVAGHFALSQQRGVVLAYFKAAEVELWRQGRSQDRYIETSLDKARAREPHAAWDAIDRRLQELLAELPEEKRTELVWSNLAQGNRTSVDSFRVSAALSHVGFEMLSDHPWSTLSCCVVRCFSILTFPLNQVLRPPTGIPQKRLKWLVMAGPYVLLLAATVWGIVRRGRVHPDASCVAETVGAAAAPKFHRLAALTPVWFPLAATLVLLLASTPQIDPRFRVPMIPFLAVLALLPGHTSQK